MAPNKSQKHLLIIPEDNPYSAMANAFRNHFAVVGRQVQVMKPAGGWLKLVKNFLEDYESKLQTYKKCYILLLLDLDGDQTRREEIFSKISSGLQDRVFILCCMSEAEDLKKDLKLAKFESVGEALAESCYGNSYGVSGAPWLCAQLQHNKSELTRLAEAVRPFLFS